MVKTPLSNSSYNLQTLTSLLLFDSRLRLQLSFIQPSYTEGSLLLEIAKQCVVGWIDESYRLIFDAELWLISCAWGGIILRKRMLYGLYVGRGSGAKMGSFH